MRQTGSTEGMVVARPGSARTADPRRCARRRTWSAVLLGVVLAAALSTGGCMTVKLDTGGIREPVSMTAEVNRKYHVVRHFDRPLRGWFTLFDLVTVQNPKVEQAIQEEIGRAQGDGVVNLSIQGQDTFADRAIPVGLSLLGSVLVSTGSASFSFVTIGLGTLATIAASQISVRTYTVSGDVIRYED